MGQVWGVMALGEHSGAGALGAVRGDLATDGWCRVAGAVSAPQTGEWRKAAEAGAPCPAASVEALLQLGPLTAVDWWNEADGLPDGPAFVLDLADRGSADGGLLLRSQGEDRVSGWRPETGALTVYRDAGMALSPTMPGVARRVAITGRLRA